MFPQLKVAIGDFLLMDSVEPTCCGTNNNSPRQFPSRLLVMFCGRPHRGLDQGGQFPGIDFFHHCSPPVYPDAIVVAASG
jgi:hypothetical protein